MLKYLVILLIFVTIVPAVSVHADTNKELCEENGGDYTKRGCDFDDDDEDKADRYGEDLKDQRDFENEKAALEDALCDDPDANFDVCQSATLAFADKDKDKDKDEDELTERDVDVLCDASEDYEAHKEQCDKLYDKVQDATLAFASSEEDKCENNGGDLDGKECNFAKLDNRSEKEACEENDGYWSKEEKSCNFDDDEDEPAHSDKGFSDWEYDEEDA